MRSVGSRYVVAVGVPLFAGALLELPALLEVSVLLSVLPSAFVVLELSALESLPSPLAAVSLPLASVAAPLSVFPDFAAPPLKSVTYQPLPFNWNPAADSCLTSVSAPHDGHVTSGASENFCRASSSWPQDEQRYS